VTEVESVEASRPTVSRRGLLGLGGAAAGGLVVGGLAGAALGSESGAASMDASTAAARSSAVAFHGAHQAGIATPVQDRLLFVAFDVTSDRRDDLVQLFRDWTVAARSLTAGRSVGGADEPLAPTDDTGEAAGLSAANLTLTFGVGPTLFDGGGRDRFGLAAKPAALADIPSFPRDNLDPARSGGDICVQACGDDPQVLFHAIRNLTRIGRGTVRVKWVQEGFGRTSSTTSDQQTARNLMGFKDGTANLRAGTKQFDEAVWVGEGDDPAWMRDGSYLVARRIRILIEVWDRSSLQDQEQTIGRVRTSGAPLGEDHEFDVVDLSARNRHGEVVTPADSHVRLAHQDTNEIHILRRGYNFTDGLDERVGQLDAGLFFLAYQRDPRTQFVPLQQKLAEHDALNEYIQHVSSALFAVFPGVPPGGWIGQTLLG
jgi:deferrochelatase/peroxidase EfeB